MSNWIDAPKPVVQKVNLGMRQASDAFDRAYYRSGTWADMDENVTAAINALRRVQRIARVQRRIPNQQVGGDSR